MEALFTKYRPHKFEDVCSQESTVKILTRQIHQHAFRNTYLFCGSSGCGKTTVARIFANELNEHIGSPIEIDAASNNGVDNIKLIIKSANERSIDSTYKIFIIDECHALSNSAWQALLKCIEEPPKYTIFIFCTTEKNKVPDTIKNRCQVFNFTRISSEKIQSRLMYICECENYTNYDLACDYISRTCKNQMRDAISLLEQCAAYSHDLNMNNVQAVLGAYSYDMFFDLVNAIVDQKLDVILNILNYIYNEGNDLKLFVDQFLSFCLDISKYSICNDIHVTKLPSSLTEKLTFATNFENSKHYYCYLINRLLSIKNMIKNDSDIRSTIEVEFIQIGRGQ